MHSLLPSLAAFLLASCPIFATPVNDGDQEHDSALYLHPQEVLTTTVFDDDGMRNLSYFIASDQVIVDGDAVYGTVSDLRAAEEQAVSASTGMEPSAAGFRIKCRPWPGATVKYRYDSDATEHFLSTRVEHSIRQWQKKAPYLKFEKYSPNGPQDIAGTIKITSTPCLGCFSDVGFKTWKPMTLNLDSGCNGGPACGFNEAVHEFGHVLGLEHEHSRPDRDDYIQVLCQNINPGPTCSLPEGQNCCIDHDLMPKGCCNGYLDLWKKAADPNLYDWSGPYDFSSLMHYPAWAFAKPGMLTMVSRFSESNLQVPKHLAWEPSDTDAEKICSIYSWECPNHGYGNSD